jgi:hypothetical protein
MTSTTLNTKPGTFTVRDTRPTCDVHTYERPTKQALPTIVDARTRSGRWANMCKPCWTTEGTGTLGTGVGQMIYAPLTDDEVILHESLGSSECWGCDPKPVHGVNNMWEHDEWCAWLNSDMLPRPEVAPLTVEEKAERFDKIAEVMGDDDWGPETLDDIARILSGFGE